MLPYEKLTRLLRTSLPSQKTYTLEGAAAVSMRLGEGCSVAYTVEFDAGRDSLFEI